MQSLWEVKSEQPFTGQGLRDATAPLFAGRAGALSLIGWTFTVLSQSAPAKMAALLGRMLRSFLAEGVNKAAVFASLAHFFRYVFTIVLRYTNITALMAALRRDSKTIDDVVAKRHMVHLKTKEECRLGNETIQVWTVELPSKHAEGILRYFDQHLSVQLVANAGSESSRTTSPARTTSTCNTFAASQSPSTCPATSSASEISSRRCTPFPVLGNARHSLSCRHPQPPHGNTPTPTDHERMRAHRLFTCSSAPPRL